MNTKQFLVLSVIGLFLAGCVALDEALDSSGSRQYTTKSFSVPPGGTDTISFNVNAQGSVTASIVTRGLASSTDGGADSMLMALESPSGANIVQNEGNPHERLRISYRVPRSAQAGMWRVTLTNNSQKTISGTLKVYYPFEDTGNSREKTGTSEEQTTVQNEPPQQEDTSTTQNGGAYEDNQGSQQTTTTSQGSGSNTGSATESGGSDQTTSQTPSQPQQGGTRNTPILVYKPKIIVVKPIEYGIVTNNFDLTLRDKRDKFYFHVRRAGKIDVYARWQGNKRLSIILNGPSQESALTRKDGMGYVHLVYNVKQNDIREGRMWKATVVNFADTRPTGNLGRDISSMTPIKGHIEIKYPKN